MKNKKLLTALAALTLGGATAIGLTFAGCGHTHEYSEDWKSDETGHWHYAICDDLKEGDEEYKSDFAAHTFGDDNECDICGYKKAAPTTPGGGDDGDKEEDGDKETVTISLNKEELTLSIDNLEQKLTATVSNGAEVVWSSDNESVVLVGEEGDVVALKPGAATITATVKDTEVKATCEVLVEDAYYLIGGMDSAWNKVGTFDQSGAVYFMPTETEGIYKTASTELLAKSDFQVAVVGITADNWWQKAYNGNYIAAGDEVLSKNNGGNIAVEKHGKYTITLDLTGEQAVVSGVCDEEIDDGDVEYVYYIRGGVNNWAQAGSEDDAGEYAFTNNGDGTYSLTIELTKGQEFKIAVAGQDWIGAFGESAVPRDLIGQNGSATADTDYQLTWTSSDNIGVGVTGIYTFTLTPAGETNNQLSYTFEAVETEETVLHYYIKGTAVADGGWSAPATEANELKATNEDGIYSMTIKLNAGEFMFYSKYKGVESGDITEANETIKADALEDKTFVTGDTGNMTAVAAGTYTFTYNSATKKLSVSFVADTTGGETEA